MSLAVQIIAWFVGLSILMSIVEHQVHARMMHKRPRLSFLKNLRARQRMFTSHAIEHHRQYLKNFNDEPVPHGEDRGIRLNLLEGLVESLPVSLVLACFSLYTPAIIFPLVVCLHHTIWNLIHLEMHKPENRFFSKWAAYRAVARHHFLHHRYPDKNFNVAFPIGDFLFGTVARPSEADRQAMKAEGIAA
jgi:hypothetical protein